MRNDNIITFYGINTIKTADKKTEILQTLTTFTDLTLKAHDIYMTLTLYA